MRAPNYVLADATDRLDEFEIHCCMHFGANLKYTLDRHKHPLMYVWPGMLPLNKRFLTLIGEIRKHWIQPHSSLFSLYSSLGFGKPDRHTLETLYETVGRPWRLPTKMGWDQPWIAA